MEDSMYVDIRRSLALMADALMVGRTISHALALAGCKPTGDPVEAGDSPDSYKLRMTSPAGVLFEITLRAMEGHSGE